MFVAITNHKNEIYTTLCPKALYVQQCNSTELTIIFNASLPQQLWATLAGAMERYGECSGLNVSAPLPYYYFSNRTLNGIPPNVSCTQVLEEMCDGKYINCYC